MSDAAVAVPGAQKTFPWWVLLVEGILAALFGLLLLTNPAKTSVVFAFFIGAYWLVRGVIDIVLIFVDKTMWGWKLFVGVLGILAGWIVMAAVAKSPLLGTLGLATAWVWVLGIIGIVMGIADIVQAFQGAGWGRGLLGVLMVVLGGWLMLNATSAALVLPWALGILFIGFGIAAAVASFSLRTT